jgi:hypothetical protein
LFGEIFSATLATSEMAEPLKNVSFVWFLSVWASLMAFEMLDLFTISAPANSHQFNRRASAANGMASDRSRNQSSIERTGQFLDTPTIESQTLPWKNRTHRDLPDTDLTILLEWGEHLLELRRRGFVQGCSAALMDSTKNIRRDRPACLHGTSQTHRNRLEPSECRATIPTYFTSVPSFYSTLKLPSS